MEARITTLMAEGMGHTTTADVWGWLAYAGHARLVPRDRRTRFPDALGEMTTGEAELLVHVLAHLAAGMRG